MNFIRYLDVYETRNQYPCAPFIGDIGAMEKLALENAFRENGLDGIAAVTYASIWSNVVHIRCVYDEVIYSKFLRNLRDLPETPERFSWERRFLVALGRSDLPS